MKYETLVKDIPQNEIEVVTMSDGSIIQCKKVPIATVESMDVFLSGVKDGLNTANSALGFVATCGSTKLYSAVGDASTYMKSKSGNILSSTVNSKGKITGNPGFQEVELAKEGSRVATTVGKAIPWIALAVTVIEVGTKIVLNQEEIKQKQLAMYNKYCEINEDNVNNLWQALNDYSLSKHDEAHRTADLVTIKTAFNEANNSFRKLDRDLSKSKTINDNAIYAMKSSLDVYSFAYLLKIMYSKVDDLAEYIDNAIKDITQKTEIFESTAEKCLIQQKEKSEKHNKVLTNTQYDNNDKSKKKILFRAGLDVLTLGLAELGSLGSKEIGKKVKQVDADIISKLTECKNSGNPFLDCIKNANKLIMLEKPVLKDDKYLYYQIN